MTQKFINHAISGVITAILLILACLPSAAYASERFITLASTTSTENSGLFETILPAFTEKTGIEVRVVAVGTGQAIRLAERGDADVLLVHHKPSEENFVALGFGVKRHDVMYNDFVLIGPAADSAAIRGLEDADAALARIADQRALFVSRGDNSGTHKREQELWAQAGINPVQASGTWYSELGAGMGATLNTAAALGAYTLSDRGSWLSFNNKAALVVLLEGDPALFNQYGIILVNPARHPHVKATAGQAFIDWIISPAGQDLIADFKIDGQTLFTPNAAPPD